MRSRYHHNNILRNYLDTLTDDFLFEISIYLSLDDQINLYYATHDNFYTKNLIHKIVNKLKCQTCQDNNSQFTTCHFCKKNMCDRCTCLVVCEKTCDTYTYCRDCNKHAYCLRCSRVSTRGFTCSFCNKWYCDRCESKFEFSFGYSSRSVKCGRCACFVCNKCCHSKKNYCKKCINTLCAECIQSDGIYCIDCSL
jgi:hypothetical protein